MYENILECRKKERKWKESEQQRIKERATLGGNDANPFSPVTRLNDKFNINLIQSLLPYFVLIEPLFGVAQLLLCVILCF